MEQEGRVEDDTMLTLSVYGTTCGLHICAPGVTIWRVLALVLLWGRECVRAAHLS